MKFANLKVGSILSETSYTTVKTKNSDSVILVDTAGNIFKVGKEYVEAVHKSADDFDEKKIVKMTQTELIDVLFSSANVACSAYYRKQNTPKTKKAYLAERNAAKEAIKNAPITEIEKLIDELIDNPPLDYIPGELRLIKGYHEGKVDERGRLRFIDMEDGNKEKQVDPRTLQYVIVKGVKYIKK